MDCRTKINSPGVNIDINHIIFITPNVKPEKNRIFLKKDKK